MATLPVRFTQHATDDGRALHGSEEVRPGIILDLDDRNEVVGLEILKMGPRLAGAQLKRLEFELI